VLPIGLGLLLLSGCAVLPHPAEHWERVPPALAASGAERDPEPFRNWSLRPAEAEAALAHGAFRSLERRSAGGGTTGAARLRLEVAGHERPVDVKWKRAPRRLDGINNSPRRELAAYEVQKLVLDPDQYVVPTTVVRCVTTEMVGAPEPAFRADASCALGALSLWLEDVTLPDVLYDAEAFAADPGYALPMAHFDLVTYLIDHEDGRRGNFLVSKSGAFRRVYAVDNGVSFGGIFYNWFVRNWDGLRVPALPRAAVDRLRGLRRDSLDRLGVLAQLERRADGRYENVAPGANLDPDAGVRIDEGVVQLGLERDEIDGLWERIQELIEDVDEGDLRVF